MKRLLDQASHETDESKYVIVLQNQRVPADMVLLRTAEKSGTCFIRTDQLDGETDWKLRVAVAGTHSLPSNQASHATPHNLQVTFMDQ